MWNAGTYDPDLNLLYVGTGNPTPVLNGPFRPGDNKWTCSIVALNPDTGKLAWGFQASPHDTHDWDAAEVPVLVDGDVRRRAAQDADAGVAQRLLLRPRPHQRQEPADDDVRGRELGDGRRTKRASRSRTRRRNRPATDAWSRRTRAAAPTTARRASIRRPACSSSAPRTRTASTSSSPSTASTGGPAPTTGCGARARSERSTTRPARCAGSTT